MCSANVGANSPHSAEWIADRAALVRNDEGKGALANLKIRDYQTNSTPSSLRTSEAQIRNPFRWRLRHQIGFKTNPS
jgi:hypothetical protein